MAADPSLMLNLARSPGLIGQAFMQGQEQAQQMRLARQQEQVQQFQLNEAQRQAQLEQAYQADVAQFLADPSPQAVMALATKYPKKAEAIKQGWDIKDTAQRSADMGFFGSVYSSLDNGKPELAARRIRDRITAEKAAGKDVSELEEALQSIESGDANGIKAVKAIALTHLAAADSDKFALNFKAVGGEDQGAFTLGPGAKRFSADGKLIAEAPFAPRPVTVGEGDTVVEYDPNNPGGGDPASGGGSIYDRMLPITEFAESGGRERDAKGNLVTSPKGAQGKMQVMPGTRLDPGFGVKPAQDDSDAERTRVGQDYLKAMIDRYSDPAKAWAAYNAGPGAVDDAVKSRGGQWLQALPAETRRYVAQNMSKLQRGGPTGSGTRVIAQGAPKRDAPPSGYRWTGDGNLEPIPGGPGDKAARGGAADPKAEGALRREFNNLAEVKDFKTVRAAYQQTRTLGTKRNATAADDIAMIFSYMKMLDPDSVVREGEFATAQNATGVPEQVVNLYNRAMSGNRLNEKQRADMVAAAESVYRQRRNAYNTQADHYRGIADEYGFSPDRIALFAAQNVKSRAEGERLPNGTPYFFNGKGYLAGQGAPASEPAAVRVRSVQEAQKLKPGTIYITPDGRRKRR